MPWDDALRERIHALWDDVAGFEAAQSDLALMYLLEHVAELVDAQNAYWVGALRISEDEHDPLRGWRPRVIQYLRPLPHDDRFSQQRLRAVSRGDVDELTVGHARGAGTYRSARMCDLVPPDWFERENYQGYLSQGVYDSLTVIAPVGAAAEAYYGFLRMRPNDPFTEDQREVALYAMRGLTWFHRQALLTHGLLVARSRSPRPSAVCSPYC